MGIAPSRANIEDQWGKAVRVLNQLRKFASTHTQPGTSTDVGDNFLAMQDALTQALNGEYASEGLAAIRGVRSRINDALAMAAAVTEPWLREYCRFIGAPEVDSQEMITRIYEYMITYSLTVQSRKFTYGTPAAGGSNVGNGVITRLNVDDRGHYIENQSGTASGLTKTAECISDEHTGANEHEEVFNVYGDAADVDDLRIVGVRASRPIKAISAVDSMKFLGNPSFETHSGEDESYFGATDTVEHWTVSDIEALMPSASYFYRDFRGCATPRSLVTKRSVSLTQNLNELAASFDPRIPMYCQVAYNPIATSVGTLTLRLGSQTASVVFDGDESSGWKVLRIGPADDNWHRVWNQEDPCVVLTWLHTSGNIALDDVILAPFTSFDGGWYAIVGGSIPFLRKDVFTWDDIVPASEGILQHFLYRSHGRYLPSAATGETWADPT